jgi:hypothetical protein
MTKSEAKPVIGMRIVFCPRSSSPRIQGSKSASPNGESADGATGAGRLSETESQAILVPERPSSFIREHQVNTKPV